MSSEVVVGYCMPENFLDSLLSQGLEIPVLDPLPFKISFDAKMKAPPYVTIDFAKEMPDGKMYSLLDWEKDAEDFSRTAAFGLLQDPFLPLYQRTALMIDDEHPETSGKGVIYSFSAYAPNHMIFQPSEVNSPPKGNEKKPTYAYEVCFQFDDLMYYHYFCMGGGNPEANGYIPCTVAMSFFLNFLEKNPQEVLEVMVKTDSAVRRVEDGCSIFCSSPTSMCREVVIPDKELWRLSAAVTSIRCVGPTQRD